MGVKKDSTEKIDNKGLHQFEPTDSTQSKVETPKRHSAVTWGTHQLEVHSQVMSTARSWKCVTWRRLLAASSQCHNSKHEPAIFSTPTRRLREARNTATCRSSSMACQGVCRNAKTTCTDDAASRWQVSVSCLSQLTATQLMETCIACRMHAHLHSEIQFLKLATFVQNFFPSL